MTGMDINFDQNFNNRTKNLMIFDRSLLRVGKNILTNRLNSKTNIIDLDWLNQSYDCKCKKSRI